jgi:hypothetical protein
VKQSRYFIDVLNDATISQPLLFQGLVFPPSRKTRHQKRTQSENKKADMSFRNGQHGLQTTTTNDPIMSLCVETFVPSRKVEKIKTLETTTTLNEQQQLVLDSKICN